MQDKANYTNIESINRKIAFLAKNSTRNYLFNISPYLHFSSLKSQAGIETSLFPQGIPNLIGATSDCMQCFYGFQLDTYMSGCSHDCIYCWAKSELSKIGQWNNTTPIPIDISSLWELFYKAFETDEKFPLRTILLKRIPLRIGSMSDPFLAMEKKYKNTLETLKILKLYNYPCLILTRSEMVADDAYIKVMDPKRTSVQFSILSLDENLVNILEPGAGSPKKRLEALKKLNEAGIWSSIRLNPLFPNFPDGHFSDKLNHDPNRAPSFNFFNINMINQISEYGCKSLLAGFVHMDGKTVSLVSRKINFELRSLMKEDIKNKTDGFRYSSQEIRAYYELISEKCRKKGMAFSTCYLGLGDSFFWKDQDLWADKNDCCNIKANVPGFNTDTREISFEKKIEILYPSTSFLKLFFTNLLLKFKSFILKNIGN